jgi:hypothetical protein
MTQRTLKNRQVMLGSTAARRLLNPLWGCQAALGGADLHFMSLVEILTEFRSLWAADKPRSIRLLAWQVDAEGYIAPLEHRRTYTVSTPVFEPGASEILQRELETALPPRSNL